MDETPFLLFKSFSDELDPKKLQQKFLAALLKLQNVERGSIWVKQDAHYCCVEAAGFQAEKVMNAKISEKKASIVGWVIENGKMAISDPARDPRHYKKLEENLAVKSSLILCFPLFLRDKNVYGAVQIIDTTPGKEKVNLDKNYLSHVQELINIGAVALSNAVLFSQQKEETQSLKHALNSIRKGNVIVGQSPAFYNCMEMIRSYAHTDYPVMVTGESGTGKELIAHEIQRLSHREDKPFLVQNCSAIPETLLESELFGYKKGAFSGAATDKIGLFEAAEGGTIFLDEIGDMPLNLQARILRVIQNNEIKPLGDTRAKKVDIRVISATNKNIKEMVAVREFRKDLFYRLSVLPLHLPPLRERREDIPILFNFFIKRESQATDIPIKTIAAETLQQLISYPWPGNIRELENLVRYLLVATVEKSINPQNLPSHLSLMDPIAQSDMNFPPNETSAENRMNPNPPESRSLFDQFSWEELEKAYADYLLDKHNWNISRAARHASINRSTFASRLKRLGIRKPGESD
jgi:transcriptional regulator with GAF, ATPase, and Fis domain